MEDSRIGKKVMIKDRETLYYCKAPKWMHDFAGKIGKIVAVERANNSIVCYFQELNMTVSTQCDCVVILDEESFEEKEDTTDYSQVFFQASIQAMKSLIETRNQYYSDKEELCKDAVRLGRILTQEVKKNNLWRSTKSEKQEN